MLTIKVLIIVPCYNEESALPGVLNALANVQPPAGYSYDVLVVDDGSTDETPLIALRANVPLLCLPVNLGIGGAVQSGLIYAQRHNYILAIQLDGDGQHPPAQLDKLIEAYQITRADVVIGSRFLGQVGYSIPIVRRTAIRFFSGMNRWLTGTSIADCTSGFRMFGPKAIALAAEDYPDDYPEPVSLIQFARAGLTVAETPVLMSVRQGGQSSIRNFTSLYYGIKVSLAMLFSFTRKPA